MRFNKFIFPALLVVVYILYSGSISFPFVYDDIWRIAENNAIKFIGNPLRFFVDPTTQAGTPMLHHDNYRPLSVLLTAVQYSLWGDSASDFRLLNLVLHAANAFMVLFLGIHILGLSFAAAVVAALVFLTHPVQVESVAWVSSQSNLSGTFLFLLALWTWWKFINKGEPTYRWLTHAAFLAALFTREICVVFPLAAYLITPRRKNKLSSDLFIFAAEAAVFFILRWKILGQLGQAPLWGDSIGAHLANVLKTWPLFLKMLVWPNPLRVTYSDLPVAQSFFRPDALLGLVLLGSIMGFAGASQRRRPRLAFCLWFLLVLWLPVSNLIPLRTLFAERLVYPLVIPAAWMLALMLDQLWKTDIAPWSRVSAALVPLLIMTFSFMTTFQTRVWTHEYDLWLHAAEVAPKTWFSWSNLSAMTSQASIGTPPHISAVYLRMAEDAGVKALEAEPPIEAAAELFLRLAAINKMQGDMASARTYADRAYQLNPELKKVWSLE